MAVSEAKLEANRRNSQKSTGPKTEAGKSRSKLNAVTHGMRAAMINPANSRRASLALFRNRRGWQTGEVRVPPVPSPRF